MFSVYVAGAKENELPKRESHLRVLNLVAFELFTGAREETLTHIQLKDIEFIWMQSHTTQNWIPGVLVDYRNVKFDKDPFHRT